MKKLVTLIVLILLATMFADAQKYLTNPETRSIVLNYPDSTVKFEILNVEKNIKFDDKLNYFWYSTDKISSNRGGIGGKPLHGTYHVSSKLGGLIAQGLFSYGLKDGNWKYWYTNGELRRSENWKKGTLNGKQINYNRSGNLEAELNFKDGFLDGKCLYHHADSVITKEYRKGKEVIYEEKESFLKRKFKKKDKAEEVSEQPKNTEAIE